MLTFKVESRYKFKSVTPYEYIDSRRTQILEAQSVDVHTTDNGWSVTALLPNGDTFIVNVYSDIAKSPSDYAKDDYCEPSQNSETLAVYVENEKGKTIHAIRRPFLDN